MEVFEILGHPCLVPEKLAPLFSWFVGTLESVGLQIACFCAPEFDCRKVECNVYPSQ